MPTNRRIRERLIRLVQQESVITRRKLGERFNSSDRCQADAQIGQLVSDGVFVTTGIGRRGMPEKIQMGPSFPKHKCPFCLQELAL